MVDPVVELFDREPDRDKRARSLKLGHARDKMRQAFAEALVQAMRRAAAEKAALAGSSTEIASLANAFADVALGESVVLRLNPDRLGEGRGAVKAFLETIVRVSRTSDESRLEAAIEKLAEVILPDDLGIARGALASDNLNLRDRFIAETPQLTSADVGRMSGLRTKNPYATAARWKKSATSSPCVIAASNIFPRSSFATDAHTQRSGRRSRPSPATYRIGNEPYGSSPPTAGWQTRRRQRC